MPARICRELGIRWEAGRGPCPLGGDSRPVRAFVWRERGDARACFLWQALWAEEGEKGSFRNNNVFHVTREQLEEHG